MTEPTQDEKIAAMRALMDVVESVTAVFPDGLFTEHRAGLAAILRDLEACGWRPITETEPSRHGNYVRVYAQDGALYCPPGGEATHYFMLPAFPNTSDGGGE